MKKNGQEASRNEQEQPTPMGRAETRYNRRQMLATIGAAGVFAAAGGLLSNQFVNASAAASTGQLSPQDAELLNRMQNEAASNAVNLRWYGAVGDGVTNDVAAWNAAIAAVPVGGSLYVPPGKYFSPNGFVCGRGDISIFGAGPSSHLLAGMQKTTLEIGNPDRVTRVQNVNVFSMKFTQNAGPSGGGQNNNYAGIKTFLVDRAVIFNNDFENCDVCISFAPGAPSLGFPGRVAYRNCALMNRMLNTNKMGVEAFFQNDVTVSGNQMINEDSYSQAESHAVRLIGSHQSICTGNNIYRFSTGVSVQGGSSNGTREVNGFYIADNKFSKCKKGVQGFHGVYNGQILNNLIENMSQMGIEFRRESMGSWDNLFISDNLITADMTAASASTGSTFKEGERLVFSGNQSIGFGNGQSSGAAYHVYVEALNKIAVIEGNYFEDNYRASATNRNRGVRVVGNAKTVISRNNVFLSPAPNAAEQNIQESGTGQFIKGFAGGVEDMNDYLQL